MTSAEYKILFDGTAATREELDRFESVSVVQEADKPSQGRLELAVCLDDQGNWSGDDESFMEILRRVRVEVRVGEGDFVPLIDGPIVGFDSDRRSMPGQSTVTVVVHDDSVLLNRKAEPESFTAGAKDSDIATQIFGLYPEIASTLVEDTPAAPAKLPPEPRRRGTHMQLLRRLARRNDVVCAVVPGDSPGASVGVFRSTPVFTEKPPELVLLGSGRNIEAFDVQLNAQRQSNMVASTLSFSDKTTVTRKLAGAQPAADRGPRAARERLRRRRGAGGARLRRGRRPAAPRRPRGAPHEPHLRGDGHGARRLLRGSAAAVPPGRRQARDDADQRHLRDRAGDAPARPVRVHAGVQARRRLAVRDGRRVEPDPGGAVLMPVRVDELTVAIAEHIDARVYGKYRGLVDTVGTGNELGFVKATVPEVLGTELTGWARPAVPFAGAKHGLLVVPEKGDGVWIEFEAGDVSKPIWTGCWWGDKEIPKPGAEKVRVFVTSNGQKLVFDEDKDEILLEHGGGPSIKLTADDITLAVGGKKIVISKSGVDINGGALEVK